MSPTSRRSSPHTTTPASSASERRVTVTPVLIGKEGVKIDGIIVVVISLYISHSYHFKYEVEGGHKLVQTAGDLDTAVRGLGGAVREDLDVGPGLVSDVLDLLPALTDDATHDGLVDE